MSPVLVPPRSQPMVLSAPEKSLRMTQLATLTTVLTPVVVVSATFFRSLTIKLTRLQGMLSLMFLTVLYYQLIYFRSTATSPTTTPLTRRTAVASLARMAVYTTVLVVDILMFLLMVTTSLSLSEANLL